MVFKGCTARIDYDSRDNIFVGRILGVRSIISFHGETVAMVAAQAAGKSLNQWAADVVKRAVR